MIKLYITRIHHVHILLLINTLTRNIITSCKEKQENKLTGKKQLGKLIFFDESLTRQIKPPCG